MNRSGAALIFGGVRGVHRRLMERGVPVILAIRYADLSPADAKSDYKRVVILKDVDDHVEVVARLQAAGVNLSELALCAAFHDDYHEVAYAVASAAGLPYPYSIVGVRNTKDKIQARRVAEELTKRRVPAILIPAPAEDLRGFMADLGGRAILKPSRGTGSMNVKNVSSVSEIEAHIRRCPKVSDWILEEHLEGKEYSVESFSVGGRTFILGITEKTLFADTFVESGHIFRNLVDQVLEARIADFVRDFLHAADVLEGPAHTELIVEESGSIHLIESHCRMGGDYIWELIRAGTGASMDEMIEAHLLGEEVDIPHLRINGVGMVRFTHVAATGARVRDWHGVTEARAIPGAIIVEPLLGVGQIPVPLTASRSRSLAVVVHADSLYEAEAISGQALARVSIELEVTL